MQKKELRLLVEVLATITSGLSRGELRLAETGASTGSLQPSACERHIRMYVPEGAEVRHAEGCLRERNVGLLAHHSQHEEDHRHQDHSAIHPRQQKLQQAHGDVLALVC